jgi:hypothetical protein
MTDTSNSFSLIRRSSLLSSGERRTDLVTSRVFSDFDIIFLTGEEDKIIGNEFNQPNGASIYPKGRI